MTKYRCPACGEIELLINDEGFAECGNCPHEEWHVKDEYPGFNDFIRSIGGFDTVDNMGLIDAMQMAYNGGRTYEIVKSTGEINRINAALDKVSLAMNQAE